VAEIPGSPVSRHDLDTIRLALARSFTDGFMTEEILVSSRRLREDGLRAFGIPVRRNDDLDLNDGLLADGREPYAFAFES
jgi:hypothetical protein